jgi:hypothetical protein
LPKTDLVGQYQAGLLGGTLVSLKNQFDEIFLVLPQSDLVPVDRCLDDSCCRVGLGPILAGQPTINDVNNAPVGQAFEVLDDRLRLEPRPVLHRLGHPDWEFRLVRRPTPGAFLDLSLMLGHFDPHRWEIEYLPLLMPPHRYIC